MQLVTLIEIHHKRNTIILFKLTVIYSYFKTFNLQLNLSMNFNKKEYLIFKKIALLLEIMSTLPEIVS